MSPLVIVAVVVAIAVIVALAATNPMMRRREDEAIAAVKEQLGAVELIEPRTTAMGTEPEEAGGVRGMACLGLERRRADGRHLGRARQRGASPGRRSPRSTRPADDPAAAPKATITVTYARPEGGEATAMFRLRDAADWLERPGLRDGSGDEGRPRRRRGRRRTEGDAGGPSLDKDRPSADPATGG